MALGIRAALLLAAGRGEGLALLDGAPEGAPEGVMLRAARSFWALPAALPGFMALHVMDWLVSGGATGVGFVQDLLGYLVGWLGFAVLSHRIAVLTGRAALWPRYIAAWNWCNVVQYLMLVVAGVPAVVGAPDWMVETAWVVAMGWALWLEYFTTRLALAMPARQAIGMVLLDFCLGAAITLAMAGMG